MRKTTISAVAIVLSALVFVFSGCDMSVNISGEETTTPEPDTAVVEITNEEGTVIATENVTMSAKDKEDSKNFFKESSKKDKTSKKDTGISKDRLEQALKEQETQDNSDTLEDEMNNPETDYVQDDMAVLKSNQYLVQARVVLNGESSPYKIARKGKKSAMTVRMQDQDIGVIFAEEKIYLLSVAEKQYTEIPKSLLEQELSDEELDTLSDNWFNLDRNVKKKTTEKIDGVKYSVIIYDSGVKDYFVGKTLMKTVAEDGSVMYYDSISPVAPSSLFYPPKGYTKAEVDFESTTASTTECTDPNHKHDNE